jgi:NSS family neurotransmitter:Na+ symporter
LIVSLTNGFEGLTAKQSSDQFQEMTQSPVRMLLTHTIFMIACVVIVIVIVRQGIKNGIERASRIMMSLLLFIMVFLVIYSAFAGDYETAVHFLFSVDFSKIDQHVVLVAVGLSFLSESIGAGILYGGMCSVAP